jgi:tetratricopeptide (TPR) repeat protein
MTAAETTDAASRAARSAIDDYWKSATLWRTNVLSWGVAAFTELVVCAGPKAADGVEFASLPAESQQRLIGALRVLESLVSEDAPARSAVALEMRGMLQFLTGSRAAAAVTLKRAVRLDPGRFQAWEVLLALYIRGEDRTGLMETCESRVRARPNARNHLLLVKALERSGKYAEALEAAQTGTAKFPENLWLQVATVCLSLRTSTDSASLEAVPVLLRDITARLDKLPKNAEWGAIIQHFVPTLCLYHALAGNAEEARRVLKEWVKSNPEDAWAREILDAVGV